MTASLSYTPEDHCNNGTHKFTAFTSRYLVAASNGGRSSASEFPNCPRPQLTVHIYHNCKSQLKVKVKARVTLQLAVYHQSVRFGANPLETHDQRFFQLNSCCQRPYVTSSLTRRWVCLLWIRLAFSSSVHFEHTACYWKFFLLHYTQVLCQYRLYRADHAYLTYLMLQRQLVNLKGRKLDHRQV
jgi:hypothetical protein